ncbi:LysR family transcriptional regulator [Sulfitobacter pseudonitzschiae]|nr:LysR family transcriptional regulator [Pseudosulfitobacter pseudonitzschiae]MBM1831167.1 LysR family transcriptional regulator [Pseudosulfitobacter pseudonitzschiae]MBM1836034.1 LysR family transcriptional regulator [Pseudosulfitobacter pseudonitzschiae]MBM1840880.1 LysR family transcriptional regulator [Pseudosulfitobacter pseudonitzschiae]MBM1845132.1 LysR family transcriptional regulator [Pseudosulfitobacter pseudonitzschiae]
MSEGCFRKVEDALNWNDTPAFLAVARTGTLTGAAASLGAGVATVSRRIERLEAALGVPLFARAQTGYQLTDEGTALMPRAEALEAAMEGFQSAAQAGRGVRGHVRLATAENLANPLLIPSLASLLATHPGLTVEVSTDVASVNLHKRDADLAVRMVRPTRGHLTVRRIGTLGFGLYGAVDYMAQRCGGVGFEADSYIGWADRFGDLPAAQWLARSFRDTAPVVVTSTLASQLSAARAGLGLAVLPHFLAQEAGLERLPVELGVDQDIWLVMHSDLMASQRVRVVADHLVGVIDAHAARLRGT